MNHGNKPPNLLCINPKTLALQWTILIVCIQIKDILLSIFEMNNWLRWHGD